MGFPHAHRGYDEPMGNHNSLSAFPSVLQHTTFGCLKESAKKINIKFFLLHLKPFCFKLLALLHTIYMYAFDPPFLWKSYKPLTDFLF